MTNHPINPPQELVQQWLCSDDYLWGPLEQTSITITTNRLNNVATQAARWGSDQELEACCKWLPKLPPWSADDLRRHRRPKPPSLKEQALAVIENSAICDHLSPEHAAILRRALEQLDD
jgi:hypothetical protein